VHWCKHHSLHRCGHKALTADPALGGLPRRLTKLSPAIRDIAWKGQIRLCSRYRRLAAAGKPKVVVTTAIAREMVGFIWAIVQIAQPALEPLKANMRVVRPYKLSGRPRRGI
jgi:hypothetical protein